MPQIEFMGHTITVDERMRFAVTIGGEVETFNTLDAAKKAVAATAKAAAKDYRLEVMSDRGKEVTILGINRTSSDLRGDGWKHGYSYSSAAVHHLYPRAESLQDAIGMLRLVQAQAEALEKELAPYQIRVSRGYGRMTVEQMADTLDDVTIEFQEATKLVEEKPLDVDKILFGVEVTDEDQA